LRGRRRWRNDVFGYSSGLRRDLVSYRFEFDSQAL
jgi:hypothetical protein